MKMFGVEDGRCVSFNADGENGNIWVYRPRDFLKDITAFIKEHSHPGVIWEEYLDYLV